MALRLTNPGMGLDVKGVIAFKPVMRDPPVQLHHPFLGQVDITVIGQS